MRSFRCIAGLALAAIMSSVSLFASAADHIAERVLVRTVEAVGSYGDAVARYEVEQTYQRGLAGEVETAIRSDLVRDSNGYRLAGVERTDDFEGFAPV